MRNGALFSIFSFFNSGISFVLLIILAKFIDPEGYGYLNLFNTLITILGFVVCLNTYGVISVNYFRKSEDDFQKSVNSVNMITIASTLVLGIIIFICNCNLEKWTGLNLKYQIYALLVSFLSVYSNIALNIWRVREEVGRYGVFSCLSAVTNFLLAIILVVVLHKGWQGRIDAYVISALVFFLISSYVLIKKGFLLPIKFNKELIKDALQYGIPLIPHNISSWLRQGLDRIFLNSFQSIDIVGLFSFSFNFANIIMIIGNAFNATNSVWIFKNLSLLDESVIKRINRQNNIVTIFFAGIATIVFVLAYLLIPLLFPEYEKCRYYLLPQCLGAFFYCVYLQYVNVLFYYKRTKQLMYITFGISVLHATFSYLFTRFSVYYTLWIGAAGYFLIALLIYIISKRYLNNEYKIQEQAI